MSFVRLQTGKVNSRQIDDAASQLDRRLSWRHTAAPHPDIDLNQQEHRRTDGRRRAGDRQHLLDVIDGHADFRPQRQSSEPLALDRADDLVGDQHVVDPVFNEYLGLTQLRARHADRAQCQLALGQSHALMVLKMRPQLRRAVSKKRRHLGGIAIRCRAIK